MNDLKRADVNFMCIRNCPDKLNYHHRVKSLMKEKMNKERDEMKKVSESISNRKAAHRAELEAIRSNV